MFNIFQTHCIRHVDSIDNRSFPNTFKFGVASSAYQIEGAWNEDNKGENIWDHICHLHPEFIDDISNGDIACDSYHKYKDDVDMLSELGVDYYRFSLSWSRILPKGVAGSPVNQQGISYYRSLLQELIEKSIEPMVTIYCWDLPQPLQDLGGWPNPELIDHYVYYAKTVFEQLGDLVKIWTTFNEAFETCFGGYGGAGMAPNISRSGIADYLCAHTIIKAHAKTYHLYKDEFKTKQNGVVSIVIDSSWIEPGSEKAEDFEAAERGMQFTYGWFANPIVFGNYPDVMIKRISKISQLQGFEVSRLPTFSEDEIEYNKGTFDFLTINTYTTQLVSFLEDTNFSTVHYYTDLNVNFYDDPSWESAASTWLKVVPWGIRKLINWISNTYGNNTEIFITENGYSDLGGLNDESRIDYFKDYLSNVLAAVLDDKAPVTRYTAWTLMDNFEWGRGYRFVFSTFVFQIFLTVFCREKFGLFSVDFNDTHRPRTAKNSAMYYKKVIVERCLVDECI